MARRAELNVQLLTITEDTDWLAALAAKQCTTADTIANIELEEKDVKRILKHTLSSGHMSILSVGHASFAVNVTREALTQINTSAWIKTVTQSQQYCVHNDFRYFEPDAFKDDPEALERLRLAMERDQEDYNWYIARGYAPQDARAVLSNALEANTIMSGNMWAWYNWIKARKCKRNTGFTLRLAQEIHEILKLRWHYIFEDLCGAPCEIGKCQESKPCGDPY